MKIINYQDIDGKLDGVYNHPMTRGVRFWEEYDCVVDEVALGLSNLGSVGIDEESYHEKFDFLMSKNYKFTRSVVVVSTNPLVFSKRIIDVCIDVLVKVPERYQIIFDGAFSRGDSFYIFIEIDEVYAWFKTPERSKIFER